VSAPVLLLAEDSRAASFHPLSDTRPMFELRTGIFSMRERAAALLPHFQLHGLARPGVAECWEESSGIPAGWQRVPEARDLVIVNARVLIDAAWAAAVSSLKTGEALRTAGVVSAARLDPAMLGEFRKAGSTWPAEHLERFPAREAPGAGAVALLGVRMVRTRPPAGAFTPALGGTVEPLTV